MYKKIPLGLGLLVLAFVLSGCTQTTTNTNTVTTTNTTDATNTSINTEAVDPEGTIVVDAGTGTLSGAVPSTADFIQEISTGTVAYLGTKGATANYIVTAASSGTYSLRVKLSDDGVWDSGFRDADVTVNGAMVVTYQHRSEDTRGWKWYTVGNVSLKVGENTIAFTKKNDMPAAYSMDEFKFVPVMLEQ